MKHNDTVSYLQLILHNHER